MHTAVAFGKEQTLPQPPQLFTSVPVLVSQPATFASQSAYGGVQAKPHTPPVQAADAFQLICGVVQTLPQVPQLFGSARTSMQT
jgi:hypothetical protein